MVTKQPIQNNGRRRNSRASEEKSTSGTESDDSSSGKASRNVRPLLSFVEMIHEALEASESGMLSLQEIYEAVRKRYPYFRTKDAAWQNSIRHNLSMQSCFYKVDRPPSRPGKGSLWVSTRSGRPSNMKSRTTFMLASEGHSDSSLLRSGHSSVNSSPSSNSSDQSHLASTMVSNAASIAALNQHLIHELIPPLSDRMPPAVKDSMAFSNYGPQVHAWSGDLWLENPQYPPTYPSQPFTGNSFSSSTASLSAPAFYSPSHPPPPPNFHPNPMYSPKVWSPMNGVMDEEIPPFSSSNTSFCSDSAPQSTEISPKISKESNYCRSNRPEFITGLDFPPSPGVLLTPPSDTVLSDTSMFPFYDTCHVPRILDLHDVLTSYSPLEETHSSPNQYLKSTPFSDENPFIPYPFQTSSSLPSAGQ